MTTPTPEEFAEWQQGFEAWTKDAVARVCDAEERANASGLENINLIGRLGEAKADLDRQGRTITDLRDLLTSAHAIAARGGEDTNWEAFIGQLKERGIGSITAKVFKMPKEDAIFWNPGNGVVQDHRDGTIVQPDTDKERAKRGLPPFTPDPGPQKLRDRIKHAINCTSAENESDTPDFILADYLMASLDAFDAATRCREKWYGREKGKSVGISAPGFAALDEYATALMPEAPVEEPTFITVTRVTRVIGQAWCRTEKPVADSPELRYHSRARIVLCNIHQDVHTGETTYVPISFDDMPQVTETPAS